MATIPNDNASTTYSDEKEIARLNEQFAKRYTNEDEEFNKMSKPISNDPPVVSDRSNQNHSQSHQYRRRNISDNYNNRNRYSNDGNRRNYQYHRSRRHHSSDRFHR